MHHQVSIFESKDAYLILIPKFTNCMSSIVVAATFVEKNSSSSFRALIGFSVFLHLVVRHLAAKWVDFVTFVTNVAI